MKGLGSGDSGEFTFIDLLAIAGFLVSLENLDLNLTQDDKQDLQEDLANRAEFLLRDIHSHLREQDEKINRILELLEEILHGID